MAESYKLTYFNLKGVGEPIRLLFAYKGIKYEDHRIEREDWPALKKTYPWGQLPVLQVGGDKTLAQSVAIYRYLGKKFDMYGSNDWERARLDEIADIVVDFKQAYIPIVLEQDEKRKAELMKNFITTTVPKYFGRFEAIIEKNNGNPYFMGTKMSWVDIQLAHYLDLFNGFVPGLVEPYPKLNKLMKKVFDNPKIKNWVETRPKTQG